MDAPRKWEWQLSAARAGVTLTRGMLQWWYVPHDPSGQPDFSRTSQREQDVEDFRQHGPSKHAVVRDEMANPESLDNLYNPFWSIPWAERNGPRLDEIPEGILGELCGLLDCLQSQWTEPEPLPPDELGIQAKPEKRHAIRIMRHPFIKFHQVPWLTSEAEAEQADHAVDAIYSQSYGYSDRDSDMKRVIPEVIQTCLPLVHHLDDFLALCAVLPAILRSLPEESQETILGYMHTYDLGDLAKCVKNSPTLNNFLTNWSKSK